MADPPAFRTGYMSILLPVETGEGEVRRIIRESVIRALAATGEWPIRVEIVTSTVSDDGKTKRWFVEYETGPYGQVIDQPDQCEVRVTAMPRPVRHSKRRRASLDSEPSSAVGAYRTVRVPCMLAWYLQ